MERSHEVEGLINQYLMVVVECKQCNNRKIDAYFGKESAFDDFLFIFFQNRRSGLIEIAEFATESPSSDGQNHDQTQAGKRPKGSIKTWCRTTNLGSQRRIGTLCVQNMLPI